MDYLIIKYLHIMSAIIMTGTGIGLAFFFLAAYCSKNKDFMINTSKWVVWGDLLFTFPAVLIQTTDSKFYLAARGYTDAETLRNRIDAILKEIEKTSTPS